MTLLFFDGFETYASTDTMATGLNDVYDIYNATTGTDILIVSSDRIPSGQAVRMIMIAANPVNTQATGFQLPLARLSSQDTWVFGVAMKAPTGLGSATPLPGSAFPIFELLDSDAERIVSLRANSDGDLTVDLGAITSTADTAVGALTGTDWNYIEWKIKISNTVGTWDVRVNEVSVMSGGPADTDGSTNLEGRPSHLRFGCTGGLDEVDYDDLYILDDQGSINNDFLGDVKVQRLRPDDLGDNEDFTRNTGSTNWEAVNELGEDDDASYVESSTVAQRDLYNYEDLPNAADTIFGVIAKPVLKKADAGSRTYKLLASSGVSEDATATRYPSNSYLRQAYVWETDPDTGVLWTGNGVNNAQFGIEIVA